MISFPNRFIFLFVLAVSLFCHVPVTAKPQVLIPKSIETFFENYCFDCHDAATAKADLDLESLNRSIVDVADANGTARTLLA